MNLGFPGVAKDKEPSCHCRRCKRHGFDPWVGKITWRRKWQPTPVFLPVEFHGERSLESYGPKGHKESDTTEATWQLSSVMWWWWCLVAKSCPTLDPMDCSPPDSSVHRILQAGILVWVAMAYSRASS